ncbi:MAG: hypothetical protein SGI96_18850 [Bacteroidota bacterium]|nr:hypothetical protein [Bacteroidota bacterium]
MNNRAVKNGLVAFDGFDTIEGTGFGLKAKKIIRGFTSIVVDR